MESLIFFISGFCAFDVENIVIISLVLVSPSQVIALKVVEIFFCNNFLKIVEERFASVNINPSVVAIFGYIMPEPFAIPYILMSSFPILHSSIDIFGLRSVVRIPIAAFVQIYLF